MNAMASLKKLLTGATAATRELTTAVEQLRTKRLAALDERDRIEAMPHPKDVILAALDRDLDALTDRAQNDVYTPSLLRGSPGPNLRLPSTDAVLGLLIAANRDAFRAQIVEQVEAAYGDQKVMTADEREAALRKIGDDLVDLERAEEALIRAAEREGLPILRREDADPDVLLLADAELE